MGGSSIRNSVHRRNHKERSQPSSRTRLGLLEKHRDYILRARDYKSKKARLRNLKEKIGLRNKDEFYYGMVRGRTEGGVHRQGRKGSEALDVEVVRVLKTQDAGYLRTMVAADESKINAIKEQLHSLADLIPATEETLDDGSNPDSDSEAGWDDLDPEDDGMMDSEEEDDDIEQLLATGVIPPPKVQGKGKNVESSAAAGGTSKGHIIFTDAKDELLSYSRTSTATSASKPLLTTSGKQTPTTAEDFGWKDPSKKGKKAAAAQAAYQPSEEAVARFEKRQAEREKALVKLAKQHRKRLLTELASRVERVAKLRGIERQMSVQRSMMNGKGGKMVKQKGGRVVHEEDDEDPDAGVKLRVEWTPKIVKWKAERKR